ncbi:Sin-like protein conserved region-domain-containing protein [Chiua virens]|nr:Sin-like protein conserved region-domain-containing protein [Chiua virens]
MPSIPSSFVPTPHPSHLPTHSPPITPRAQPSMSNPVIVNLSTLISISDFPRFYPGSSPDSFQPMYYTLADGSLLAPPLLDDLRINNIFLIITGSLLIIFLRNVFTAAIYLWRGNVKKKALLHVLFFSQLLGPIAIIPIIVAQFNRSANCSVTLRITSVTSGVSLLLLVTGILGAKVYRCLDNNRFVSGTLATLCTASAVVLIVDVIDLRSLRSLSGRCYRPTAGLSPVFVTILLAESFFICACFLYVVSKSHGLAVRGRISVHLSLDDVPPIQPNDPRKDTADSLRRCKVRSNDAPPTNRPLLPSRASTLHDESQKMQNCNTPGNTDTIQDSKRPISFPSAVHPHHPASRSWAMEMPTTTKGPTSPTHPSMSRFTRYVPRISLFQKVVRDELCYTAVITVFTVVSVAMTLVGVKSAGGINTTIWVALDWALISLLVMHSFGRVIRRHEDETLLLQPSVWYQDLHTDRTTAELLRDAPQPARTLGMFSSARRRRSAAHYDINISPSDPSTRRLFSGSASSSRGDLHSLTASTSGTSNMSPTIDAESLPRTSADRHHVADECIRSTKSVSGEAYFVAYRPVNLQTKDTLLLSPPSATISGKRIRARVKPESRKIEFHVPVDARPEVWNHEKSKELGTSQREDDREKNQEDQTKQREGEEPRLTDSRLRSDSIPHCGAYMLGVVRDGRLHLVPISETHQFRPTLTYLDTMSRKSRRSRAGGSDSESDDGPPPDPDEVLPVVSAPKKEKKAAEAKEVQVSARKSGDDKGFQGGMSAARREMLLAIRAEEDELWQSVQFCDRATADSTQAFESIFSKNEGHLECNTEITSYLKSIKGL